MTFTTSLRVAKLQSPGFRAPNILAQKEFNAKWRFKVIRSHVFGVRENTVRHLVILYHNVGLNFQGFEDVD